MNTRNMTWDELMASVNDANNNPTDTAWNIYYYMKAHVQSETDALSSQEARSLLTIYMKIMQPCPSRLHSCMLSIAVKMADAYPDFRFSAFLTMWGARNLLKEDCERMPAKDGKTYPSLLERVTKAYLHYTLLHPDERTDMDFRRVISAEALRMGFQPVKYMLATKMFESEVNGRKVRSVKLIAGDGAELLADFHVFRMKPWEIEGRMFAVLPRVSKEETDGQGNVIKGGNMRVGELALSDKLVSEYFPVVAGYVDGIDAQHGHIHVFDAGSRHFVADAKKCRLRVQVGQFVSFSPIIPKYDKFKSAIIHQVYTEEDGIQAFGTHAAKVTYVDKEKGYAAWEFIDGTVLQETGIPEPSFKSGYLHASNDGSLPEVGTEMQLIVFLRRGKDKQKRPYVVKKSLL